MNNIFSLVFSFLCLLGGGILMIWRHKIARINSELLTWLGRPGSAVSKNSKPGVIAFVGIGAIVIGLVVLGMTLRNW